MKAKTLLPIALMAALSCLGQSLPDNLPLNQVLESLRSAPKIKADSLFNLLGNWSQYPDVAPGTEWVLTLQDSVFGAVPFRVFVPDGYRPDTKTLLLLLLHGAVGAGAFERAYAPDSLRRRDLFFDFFRDKGYVVLRPFADPEKKFDWVENRFAPGVNPTFDVLRRMTARVKQSLNIDDSRVYALGFSDGADGAFGLDVYAPSDFAGFVCYNSMLTQLHADDIYLKNAINRPMYLVHSDKDEIRPVEQIRLIAGLLDSLSAPLLFKEYHGYEHYDRHLLKDLPRAYRYMSGWSRNPFGNVLYWETDESRYAACDWLHITRFQPGGERASWHTAINAPVYDRLEKVFAELPYYGEIADGSAVFGFYNNNIFNILCSRVGALEIRISPEMVNLDNPVTVILNGKQVFQDKVSVDKRFVLNTFADTFDRQALWVNAIRLRLE